MKDIASRIDIVQLVHAFYEEAMRDDTIGFIFTEVARIDLEKHLPVIVDFWESVLLDTSSYRGNPMLKHLELNRKHALTNEHFTRWMELWKTTLEEHFSGPRADEALRRAGLMAELMKHKIKEGQSDKFIQ
jgi:hemoglobin